ncbi:para-aminobenzoate synthetase component 1 [Pseudomonas flavescens]|uniref:aminodeoxychorismate synthase n=1 Tax=Phytopseudomonas flavescens TaxID=29435 RepID=A0A1G8BTD7_9GAMM|nr:aminodeoxychorismate synthase component I [Pseudomonas flavescens]SDH36411.1 para-aminobenzoate synthetase component 1 [Pseudomonas flavescens]
MPTCLVHSLPYQADPAVYFERVRKAPGAVLLDAGRPSASRGRYDLLSAWPQATLSPEEGEPGVVFFARLREGLAALGKAELPAGLELPFAGGLLGYLGYDFGRRIEALPEQARDDLGVDDAALGLYAWALISDHQAQTSQLVFHPSLCSSEQARLLALFRSAPAPAAASEEASFALLGAFQADIEADRYASAIARIHAYIASGDCYQVNFAQRFRASYQGEPWRAYCALREACPTPFSGYLTLADGGAVLSLSPERFIRVSQGQVETRPIKGTQPRGRSEQEDTDNARALLESPKDRAENLMIVDLLRNDLGRSCRIGSVRVPELFALESYPNVHHLVSAVTGELAADKDVLDLLLGAFPGGSITGAPKIRAMQVIDELEPTRRGLYCGSLLYLDVRGEMDSSIAIRSLLAKGGTISCWGGGGIVADSVWQTEYQESITKVQVLLSTLEQSFLQAKL